MNHTHYALINGDNDVVAVIKRDNLETGLKLAIRDEEGSAVASYDTIETDFCNYLVTAFLNDGTTFKATLRPTWEY